ncbi:hypothetical protein WSK_2086 [Novosphingobium sp. Rr 2-17]|uniref:hypothetical protein n=1 Tax=Novosphingobium sp. Rr 2-17 TaxID=555793 RepID=UPI0002698BAA|nr:hypothetical protein [Novosphingobium sp. Rr 2-17]EIZ79241.1 hypothetical protein WSK_2086 [Novosphingobium sp. Rr 2-17]
MEYRQRVVDAAVKELRYQLGDGAVDQYGTKVEIEGSVKMSRVAEAIIRAALTSEDAIIEEIARNIAPDATDWEAYKDTATDALIAARSAILVQLDPLP